MPDYKYTAIDRNGAQTSGKIEATNDEQARQKLMAKGLMVTTLANDTGSTKPAAAQAAPSKASFTFGSKVSQNDVTIMTRQLATLIVAGLPLLRALELITKQERNPAFKVIGRIIVVSGSSVLVNNLLHRPSGGREMDNASDIHQLHRPGSRRFATFDEFHTWANVRSGHVSGSINGVPRKTNGGYHSQGNR